MTDQLRAERDLYLRLLELGSHDALEPFLDEALGLMCEVTSASIGYLAIGSTVFAVRGGADAPRIRSAISGGILKAALDKGKTISTASAFEDPRFKDQKSVQSTRISAVLAAPIGDLGVLYLQGRPSPGPFADSDVRMVEAFATHIAPLARRLVRNEGDATEQWRSKLAVRSIAGRSRALGEVFRQLHVAAGVDMTVLFIGESGTGKTELARALHESSARAGKPFVAINCATIPETLFEAEIFGAEKGAHSTATKKMPGKVSAAEGGTLFLDEIGEIPLAAQAKLLTFLQSRTYFTLGSDKAIGADVRLIAATNTNLESAIREKKFREDLYYRLNVLVVRVPPLRDRREDIGIIADELAELPLSWDARAALASAEWPGNVRELASAVQRGVAFAKSEGAKEIEAKHLFPDALVAGMGTGEMGTAEQAPRTYQEALRAFQKRLVAQTLAETGGNVTEAARILDLSRSRLYELLKGLKT